VEALSIDGSASTEKEALLPTEECECISGETTSAYTAIKTICITFMQVVLSFPQKSYFVCLSRVVSFDQQTTTKNFHRVS